MSSIRFNAGKLIHKLSSMTEEEKRKKAYTDSDIDEEIKNVYQATRIQVSKQNREEAIKTALWQGLLNQYGIFGTKREQHKNTLYDNAYVHGDLISIDFGTSNIGAEFSYTHTAIVLKSYTDYIVVLPVTSIKDGRLESKPQDEQDDTMMITSADFADIESGSYIMLYQIRSVSKNRIQKVIGNISNTTLMKNINKKMMEIYLPYIDADYNNILAALNEKENEILSLQEKIKEIQKSV